VGECNQLSEYFRVLKEHLKCPRHHRAHFIAETKRMVADFRQGNLHATEEDVLAFLGDPQDLARTYLDTLNPQELKRFRIWDRRIRRGLACGAVFLICVLSAWCFYLKTTPAEITVIETLTIYRDYGGFSSP